MLGVIGRNGSGKSTLLRLVGRVGEPNEGRVCSVGRIGALLDLGVGFQGDLSGRENVHIAGVIAGLTRKQVKDRLQEIVEFAELESFIDSPVRVYSSGMQMRLAFSVAVHTNPDILLIDEVLSVGDLAFQNKCIDRIRHIRAQGCAIMLVSHDLTHVKELCDEAIWLKEGRVQARGAPDIVIEEYTAEFDRQTRLRTPADWPEAQTPEGVQLEINRNRFGAMSVEIVAVEILDADGCTTRELRGGEPVQIGIDYVVNEECPGLHFSVSLSQDDGRIGVDIATDDSCLIPARAGDRGRMVLHIDRVDLRGGDYFVDVGVFEHEWAYTYDYHWHAYQFRMLHADSGKGMVIPPYRWVPTRIQGPDSSG
jgi:lipopolysaccharide transport system ATP-binding protein